MQNRQLLNGFLIGILIGAIIGSLGNKVDARDCGNLELLRETGVLL